MSQKSHYVDVFVYRGKTGRKGYCDIIFPTNYFGIVVFCVQWNINKVLCRNRSALRHGLFVSQEKRGIIGGRPTGIRRNFSFQYCAFSVKSYSIDAGETWAVSGIRKHARS